MVFFLFDHRSKIVLEEDVSNCSQWELMSTLMRFSKRYARANYGKKRRYLHQHQCPT